MNHTQIEQLESIRLPFLEIIPIIWRDGDMCGIANIQFKIKPFWI